MTHDHPTRRSFLVSVAGAAFLVAVPGCGLGTRLGERDRRGLLRMARLLYPHDALADEVYAEVLQPLRDRSAKDPALETALHAGLEELDRVAGRDWRTAPPDVQVRALNEVQDRAFFKTVQTAVRTQLYERPEVWKLIGYGGPSAEHGGYLHRGFDDIDWLPEN